MFVNCLQECGITMKECKNHYCSAHFSYSPPKYKAKPKGGPGKHTAKEKNIIPKMDNFYFGEIE